MNKTSKKAYFESSDGAIRIWIEQDSSIQIKAVAKYDDPVELSAQEAIELAAVLQEFAGRI
ncbi:hypothetical protein RA280_19990 [Cupriavidus sp. CV2]|uniref:hypothetical protein n=1 Tax=Cupriavidus ulmosensis TaxID=3065913 RepID=UPI00296A9AF8|nr:hypothetical protein [Cupriavidus sp. CV2]MDW3683985.1 hypothetical protein [Cupriavidus sp. CV2]